jgi:thioredoxin reductase (NADPH)
MFLATKAKKVVMLIRGPDLSKGMSSYLSARVNSHPKIQVVPNTELTSIEGESRVQSVKTVNYATGEKSTIECRGLFIFIGATPHTKWLPEQVLLDDKGFVLTGSTFMSDAKLRSHWTLDRTPCDLETTVPGILAAGDVRAGTTKRCGFAVGDGSLAVSCVHRLLSLL